MNLVLVCDAFPPMRTSASVQLRDFAVELIRQGHSLTVLLPSPEINHDMWHEENFKGVRVVRFKSPSTKNVGRIRRIVGEFIIPFIILRKIHRNLMKFERFDGILWYSPSIFHGPLVSGLKKINACKTYLIIRDIFPQWAVDIGLMRRGIIFLILDMVARYQYSLADVIGIQTSGNRKYFTEYLDKLSFHLEVLPNWIGESEKVYSSIRIDRTPLAGRKVFVYAGNMGVAQNLDIFLDLAEKMLNRTDVGFLFVGRGTEKARLEKKALTHNLSNIVFRDEIDPDELQDLYSQCVAGIVALDSRHKSHNIPGKFIAYMQNGLPVLANINQNNDLSDLIRKENVGQVCDNSSLQNLHKLALYLLNQVEVDTNLSDRCIHLYKCQFAVEHAVKQVTTALSNSGREK